MAARVTLPPAGALQGGVSVKLVYWDDLRSGSRIFKLEFSEYDMETVIGRLDDWEKRMLAQLGQNGSIADKLLGMEMVARKIEDAHAEKMRNAAGVAIG